MQIGELAFQYCSDVELIAILLGGRKAARRKATQLLKDAGSLRRLIEADGKTVGRLAYARLQAAFEIVRRVMEETLEREGALTSPETVAVYLKARIRHYPSEVFACLFLDNRHRLIKYEEMFFGTIDGTSVYPREVVRRALHHNAAAVIFAHNHPSGVAEPSRADEQITLRLRDALGLIDVRVLDHFIVGDGECLSFAQAGKL